MNEFIEKCKAIVTDYIKDCYVEKEDIFVVWSCKTLQNKKALIKRKF